MNAPAPEIDADSAMTKDMLEASIFALYENPIERKNAMDEMAAVYGIDMETGIRIPGSEAEQALEAGMASFEEQEKQIAAQATEQEAPEPDKEPEPEPAAEAKADDPPPAPPSDPAVEALQRQLQMERDARHALEQQMRDQQAAQQNDALEAKKAENARLDAEMEQTIKAAEENYGEDFAKPMRMMFEQQKQARDALVEQQFAAPPAPPEPDLGDPGTALAANPVLSKWQEADGDEWKRAVQIDNEMMASPEYLKMNFADRFAVVANKVNAELAAAQRGTPEKPAQEATEVDKALDKLKAEPDTPSSLTDLGGGGPVDDATKAYAEMAPMDLLLSGQDTETMDRLLDRYDGVAA